MVTAPDYWRQADIIDAATIPPITVIGAGGIGSPTALVLAKMGVENLTVVDFDSVEAHNLPNTMYPLDAVGKLKIDALKELIFNFTGTEINTAERLTGAVRSPIVVITIDHMGEADGKEGRIEFFDHLLTQLDVRLIIDTRMGGLAGRIFSIRTDDPKAVDFYKSTLYSDDEADELPCTARAIIYNTMMLASAVGSVVRQYATGSMFPKERYLDLANLLVE